MSKQRLTQSSEEPKGKPEEKKPETQGLPPEELQKKHEELGQELDKSLSSGEVRIPADDEPEIGR